MKTREPTMENYTFRLKSGQDLFDLIQSFVHEKHIGAGCVLSGVGSLDSCKIEVGGPRFLFRV